MLKNIIEISAEKEKLQKKLEIPKLNKKIWKENSLDDLTAD